MSALQDNSESRLRHVAIIMDGNNRWARERNLKGVAGHQAGAERLQEVVEACKRHDLKVLTVFAFSSENWNRPKQEVKGLMSLFAASLRRYRTELKKRNISLRVIGRRDRFSKSLQRLIQDVESHTSGGERTLVVAADYGGRWDIATAARHMAEKVATGELDSADIDEHLLAEHVCVSDLPDVDLLIRTGAEKRISNFLLWQLSYAELYFADCYWPDFDDRWFDKAVTEFYTRQRRFGTSPNSSSEASYTEEISQC